MTDVLVDAPPLVHVSFALTPSELPEVIELLTAVDDLWASMFLLASHRYGHRGAVPVQRFPETRLGKNSPMWVELVGTLGVPTAIGGAALAMTRWALKNPTQVGSFLPEIVRSWHDTWDAAERAKRERRLHSVIGRSTARPSGSPDPGAGLTLRRVTSDAVRASDVIAAAQPMDVNVEGPRSPWTPPS